MAEGGQIQNICDHSELEKLLLKIRKYQLIFSHISLYFTSLGKEIKKTNVTWIRLIIVME